MSRSIRSQRFCVLFALFVSLAFVGCDKDDIAVDDSVDPTTGPPPAMCEPLETRRCDCEIGTGEQACAYAGDEWSACLCPVKRLDPKAGTLEIAPAVPGSARVEPETLYLPVEGNDRYRGIESGTIVYLMEGVGFLGRVWSTDVVDNEIVINASQVEPSDAFDRLVIDIEEIDLNVPAYAPEGFRESLELEASAVPSWYTGFTFEQKYWSVRLAGNITDFDLAFKPGTRVRFDPTMSTKLDIDYLAAELNEFELRAGLDTGIDLKPTITIKGSGQVNVETELIQLAQKISGAPKVEPLEVMLGGGFTVEVTINVRCGIGANGTGSYGEGDIETAYGVGVDMWGSVIYSDGDWDTDGETHPWVYSTDTAPTWNGEVYLHCEIKPRLRLRWLNALYGYVEAGPYARATYSHTPAEKSLLIRGGVNGVAAVGAEVDLKAKVINLFEVQFPLFDIWWPLYKREFAVCGDGHRQKNSYKSIGMDEVVEFREDCDAGTLPDPLNSCTDMCECAPGFRVPSGDEPEDPRSWLFGTYETGEGGVVNSEPWNGCVNLCGNGTVDAGEVCDDGDSRDTCGGCSADCQRAFGVCGDGFQDAQCGELCDDGNLDDCDDCVDCFVSQVCGDRRTDAHCGETCDDGDQPDDRCSDTCQTNIGQCGDGVLNYNGPNGLMDECDDGNLDPCDGCDWNCRIVTNGCGDGFVCGGEDCEPAVAGVDEYNCDADCSFRECGDGYANLTAEACDELSATCDADCTVTTCGDQTVNPLAGEDCDEGGVNTFSCNADCTANVCGDGVLNSVTEACDDGDTSNCTGACDSSCSGPAPTAVCGDGFISNQCGEEVCDDGALNGQCGQCSSDCQTAPTNVCGDGVPSACEGCDDGNTVGGDGCAADCSKIEVCGDNFGDEGEACDDGNTDACVGFCNADCSALTSDVCGDGSVTGCELCEDTNPSNTGIDAGCNASQPNCAGCGVCSADVCGDGIRGASEACDPGGSCDEAGTPTCTLPAGSECSVGVVCSVSTFVCAGGCTRVVTCGDGFSDGAEMCDDGDLVEGDGCDTNCTFSQCGNGVIAPGFAGAPDEQCDDGNTQPNDGCDSLCQIEP